MNSKNPLIKELFTLQDKEYRDFTAKLIPNVDKEKIIGIRVPILRKFAKISLRWRIFSAPCHTIIMKKIFCMAFLLSK